MKLNYLAVVAAIVAFAALALPWFTVAMTPLYTWETEAPSMQYAAYLYQISGTVNGISQSVTANIWFVWGALAMVLVAAVGCLAGSLLTGSRGQLLVLMAGLLSLLSLVVFGAGLLNSDFVNLDLEPGYVMNLFAPNVFGISAQAANEFAYHYEWFLSYGFWLALTSAVLAFISTVTHTLTRKKPADAMVSA